MPGKHVRFDSAAHIPGTPSSPYPYANLYTSTPLTPPSINYHNSPYATSPLPNVPVQIAIHPALDVHERQLIYHVSQPSSSATVSNHPITSILSQSASNPPLPLIQLSCKGLPWAITITPSTGPYVTVFDVLEGLHSSLRLGITSQEYEGAPSSDRPLINAAFEHRWRRESVMDPKVRMKGVKRIDFLKEKGCLLGFECKGWLPSTVCQWRFHTVSSS